MPFIIIYHRNKTPIEEEKNMSGCSRCCFYIFIILAEILLHGVVALCLYWIVQYRWDGEGLPFSWPGTEEADLEKLWNLHPVLMVTGLIYCLGQGILLHSLSFRLFRIFPGIIMYWSCSCGLQICSKLMYILFHLLGIPCVVLGFLSIWMWKEQSASPHLYSIHSWLGLVTMGLAAVQVGQPDSCKTASKIFFQLALGVISFLLLLCCQSASSTFRTAMDPAHHSLAMTTFTLAMATAVAGITETALFKQRFAFTY